MKQGREVLCPRGHLMIRERCSICDHIAAVAPVEAHPPIVEIRWGGKDFVFETAALALASGFHV